MIRGYYRYPSIAGGRILFVCEDDLWSAPADGGDAVRLTVSFGTCSFPRLSPDGAWIAFISTDEGNPELYVMPARGGEPRRLTFLGATQAWTTGWSADGSEIYFAANPTTWYEGETRPFAIAREGRRTARAQPRSRAFALLRRARTFGNRPQQLRPGALEALSGWNLRRDLGRCARNRHLYATAVAGWKSMLADVDRRADFLPGRSRGHR